jgi:hypothetical protein
MVRFSCGCIGLLDVPGDPEGRALILWSCDSPRDGEPVAIYRRDMGDKSTGPVPPARAAELVKELAKLVDQGHRFGTIQMLLGFNGS